MSEPITACGVCGTVDDQKADLVATVAEQQRKIGALKRKLNEEMKTGPLMDEIAEVFAHWLAVCRPGVRRTPKLDAKRIGVLRARLKDGWTVSDLKRSIDGWSTDDFWMGRDKKTKGNTRLSMVERLLADSGQVEYGLGLADQAATGDAPAAKPASRAEFPDRPADPGSAVRRVLAALENRQLKIVNRTGGWEAQCPAHDDRTPSLGVDQGAEGVLLCCQTGCTVEQIAHALDLEVAALFDNWQDPLDRPMPKTLQRTNGRMPDARRPDPLPTEDQLEQWHLALVENPKAVAWLAEHKRWTRDTLAHYRIGVHQQRLIFPVRDKDGRLLTVARYKPQRKGDEPKMLGITGRGRFPFPAPEQVDRDSIDHLWLVEGEPDVLSCHELGGAAVAIPGVEWANGPKLADLAERLRDVKVAICFDCDQPGREAAKRVLSALDAVACEASVVDLDPHRQDGFDIGDLLRQTGPEKGAHVMVDYLLAADQEPRQIAMEQAA